MNVRIPSTSAATPTSAESQNSSRQSVIESNAPPITGPSATAPKIPMFITIAVTRIRNTGQPSTSAGAAVISIRLVASPCRMRPMKNSAGTVAPAVSTDADTNTPM